MPGAGPSPAMGLRRKDGNWWSGCQVRSGTVWPVMVWMVGGLGDHGRPTQKPELMSYLEYLEQCLPGKAKEQSACQQMHKSDFPGLSFFIQFLIWGFPSMGVPKNRWFTSLQVYNGKSH